MSGEVLARLAERIRDAQMRYEAALAAEDADGAEAAAREVLACAIRARRLVLRAFRRMPPNPEP